MDKLDPETRELLARAHDEIRSLRNLVAELGPKADAYDTIAQLARLTAKEENRSMTVDVVWLISQALDKSDAVSANG